MSEFPKTYDHKVHEDAIYARWQEGGFFRPENLPGARKESFTIVLPPPNVTGTLHVGHVMMLAIEDLMIRFRRMRGKRALWIPGTDHAAIATQAVVEKKLIREGMKDPRQTLGREKFLAEVEKFAAASHDRIITQMKKMGASCDWTREAYTLDEQRSLAVRTMFKMMYDDGLIYRGNRIVHWCPRCQSTLADDEVEYREEKTPFYYFKYGPVVIGTARPETKFLDKTIVVHPNDARYRDLVGKEFDVEWIEGRVRANVIADPIVDREFGSGAMTITPAHSFEDFDLAQKNNLPIVQIIDEKGNFTDAAGSFAGRSARESRGEIVEILRKKGLVDHIDENYIHNLSVCYRCGTAVEPLPKLQWFVDVNKKVRGKSLKERMQAVVKEKEITIIPEQFNKTYFHWIDHLRDWCISRQIWFGHRVPVWYRNKPKLKTQNSVGDGEMYVGVVAPEGEGWEQDSDTLDTWFSAGMWTFSTLGWPKKTEDLKTYHPTSVLETGYDILFFWVARMIMMTTYALGEVPFKTVYLHGLVRDEHGRKMSKSLGNVIDPLDMVERYGADATRLSLVIGTGPGNDTKLSEAKIAGFRNFTNKLWNIARYVLTVTETGTVGDGSTTYNLKPNTLADQWILHELSRVTADATHCLERFDFSGAGETLREFTWNQFADWYIEISKWQVMNGTGSDSTKAILLHCLERIVKLWHPFMPFVTEAVWEQLLARTENPEAEQARFGAGREPRTELLMVEAWPEEYFDADPPLTSSFALLQEIVTAIRTLRADYKIEPAKKVDVTIAAGKERPWLTGETEVIRHLARIENLVIAESAERPKGSVTAVLGTVEISLVLSGIVDTEKERVRIDREIEETRAYLAKQSPQLEDSDFLARAPSKVVADMRARYNEAEAKLKKLEEQKTSLGY